MKEEINTQTSKRANETIKKILLSSEHLQHNLLLIKLLQGVFILALRKLCSCDPTVYHQNGESCVPNFKINPLSFWPLVYATFYQDDITCLV